MSLYELKENHRMLMDRLYMADNEKLDSIFDTLESIEEAIEDKADGYASIIAQLEVEAEMHRKEAEKQLEWAKSLEKKADFMRSKLFEAMKETGKTKFETTQHKFNIRKSGTRPLKWKTDHVEDLPKFMLAYKPPVPSVSQAKAWMEEHGVEDCDWCYLGEATESLVIK